jgi:hypothetical protein
MWYSFLIHDFGSGVPTGKDDHDAFWHIRLELSPQVSEDSFRAALPGYCALTRPVARQTLEQITGVTTSMLIGSIADAWWLIGEQSEWLLHLLGTYSTDAPWETISGEIAQYLHYFANMTQLQIR